MRRWRLSERRRQTTPGYGRTLFTPVKSETVNFVIEELIDCAERINCKCTATRVSDCTHFVRFSLIILGLYIRVTDGVFNLKLRHGIWHKYGVINCYSQGCNGLAIQICIGTQQDNFKDLKQSTRFDILLVSISFQVCGANCLSLV